MVSAHITLRLVAASLLVSGIAFAGSALAKPVSEAGAPANQKVASAQTGSIATASAVPAGVVAPAPVAASETAPACARKIKVIYAGYGEAARASCIVASSTAAN